jgi:hypothetical protein
MDTQKIREAFLNAPEKIVDVEIPDWLAPYLEPGTELAIKDVPGNELGRLEKQAAKDPSMDDVTQTAALICRCLINKATGELIFQPTDRDAIASLGGTKLTPLSLQIGEFFGMHKDAIANAKKN